MSPPTQLKRDPLSVSERLPQDLSDAQSLDETDDLPEDDETAEIAELEAEDAA